MNYNTIIIGAGISGMTAAIYLKRANTDVCILEKSAPGGQLLRTAKVENYPALPNAEGSTIAMNLYDQIMALEIPIQFEEVEKIENQGNTKIIHTKTNIYTCQNIIIATGRSYRKLEMENEEKLTGKGISYCAICDGALYKGKKVAVVGAGNSAFEEALYLSNLCDEVTIISRRDEFRAEKSLIEEIKEKENIQLITNKTIQKLIGEEKLEEIVIKDADTEKEEILKVDGCFVFIGQNPETKILEQLGIELESGYILTNDQMQTNIENIYACGDCRKKELYQLVTASYDGVIAADSIIKQKKISN